MKRNVCRTSFLSLFLSLAQSLALLLFCSALYAKPFTLPILPDTQIEVRAHPEMLHSQLDWLVKHRQDLQIPIVLHVGDIVDWDNTTQWKTASDAFEKLDQANLPYALAVGNHDTSAVGRFSGSAAPGNTNKNVRQTLFFNTFFPVSRLRAQRGRFEPDKSDNAFYTFQAGGLNWLVITLEFCARPAPVAWANTILDQFPKHNAIILTHFHLNSKGEINSNNAGYGDLTCQEIYHRMISQHANVRLVLSGHVDSSAHRADVGTQGNTIYQILQDYQGEDSGGGYIRLLDIDTEKGTIAARMYSPFYDKTKTDDSQFTISNVNFIQR